MKRQKRDKQKRAFSQGFQAGIHGRAQDICPYSDTPLRYQWLGGWREGLSDKAYYSGSIY